MTARWAEAPAVLEEHTPLSTAALVVLWVALCILVGMAVDVLA
jgi:hypothetical protein